MRLLDLVIKVKEPQPSEWPLLTPGQILFTYFHFAADLELTRAVIDSGITAIAYETLRDHRGGLRCLASRHQQRRLRFLRCHGRLERAALQGLGL